MNYANLNLYDYFYGLVKQIPEGYITTYGELARALGDIRAARAVGYMLSINNDPDGIPCYKVVHTDKRMGKYALGIEEKEKRLKKDGIIINNGIIENFNERFFADFKTDYPLIKLQKEQEKIAEMANFDDDLEEENFAAIDISYSGRTGYGALVSYDNEEYNVKNIEMEVNFPYIPGYLGYRETPFIEKLSEGVPGMLLIDANGLLHPRECGLATFAGVVMNRKTIGVAKSLLIGKIDADGYIIYNNKKLGYYINKHTIVSPGNMISLESSIRKIKLLGNGKYPYILKKAHNETVAFRKRRLPS
ncbi:endonuclease V [Ferroplasma sp.]|uniref:endonuclease V n=1 Tax=Ferroplasma sp. TaxID=2591003 RepID=UPI00307F7258